MTTTSPAPFSADGARKLSPRENMQRLKAISCTLPKTNAPSCSGPVQVGIFFDGTGNNMEEDFVKLPPHERKHSNIVKLFQCMPTDELRGRFSYYVPGVGTPFPDIDDSGFGGGGTGRGGEQRICWALLDLINASHVYVHGAPLIDKARAKTISSNMSDSTNPGAMRRVALKTWQDNLKAALKDQKPRVEQINVSVFGFSRGAAQARVFVNWLFEVCTPEDGGWTFAGIPIRVQFLGIFDTVASVGVANLMDNGTVAGHQSWADNTLEIHPAVKQCVHYVAGHEVRACFPLDSVRVKSKYPPNALEVMYPGAHSDVGGGYAPGALGIAERAEYSMSVIAGANMYKAARLAGVPLQAPNELTPITHASLTPTDHAIESFNAYVKDAKIGVGPVEEMHRRHMAHYFAYRFKIRDRFRQTLPALAASPKDAAYLQKTQNTLMERFAALSDKNPMAPDFDPKVEVEKLKVSLKKEGKKPDLKTKHLIEVASAVNLKTLTPGIERFCAQYIHDSMAGFLDMSPPVNEYKLNGFGFVKFRSVFKGND